MPYRKFMEVNLKMAKRIPVEAIVNFKADGTIRPLMVVLEDGRCLVVDKVLAVEKAALDGGVEYRYSCRMCGEDMVLRCLEGRWVMEV